SFEYNAWNSMEGDILIFATTFFPLLLNSTAATQLSFDGNIIAHEMYHAFVIKSLPGRSGAFRNEAVCLSQHYHRSCQLFAEGECKSGNSTFTEDGPDLEGLRAGFELL
ncbi:hypothetical protein PENTCL1PPCAC_21658, partial [Pristionchus entomophagus]